MRHQENAKVDEPVVGASASTGSSWFALTSESRKLLLSVGLGIALLLLIGAVLAATLPYPRQHMNLISATAAYMGEAHRANEIAHEIERSWLLYLQSGQAHHLNGVESLRGQLNATIPLLKNPPFDGATSLQSLVELSNLENLAQSELSSLRMQLREIVAEAHGVLAQQLRRQTEQHRGLLTISAAVSAGASTVLLFLGRYIWVTLRANGSPLQSRGIGAGAQVASRSRGRLSLAPAVDSNLLYEAARAAERTRIGRELHDEMGAHLMSLKIGMKRALKGNAKSRIPMDSQWARLLQQVDDAMTAVARITESLGPSDIGEHGFFASVVSYAGNFEMTTGIRCNLQCGVTPVMLREEVAREAFRIFQEALTNVARHAHASRVDITAELGASTLKIEVSDNGRGISIGEILSPHSLGLIGMHERARRINGELHIRVRQEGGTVVSLLLPAQAWS